MVYELPPPVRVESIPALEDRLRFLADQLSARERTPEQREAYLAERGNIFLKPAFAAFRGDGLPAPRSALTLTQEAISDPLMYDIHHLEDVLVAMMFDRSMYASDPAHETRFLKNTTRPDSMLLDGIERALPQYQTLRSVVVTPKDLVLSLKSPLNDERIRAIIGENPGGFPFTITREQTRSGRQQQVVSIDGAPLFSYGPYAIIAPYAAWIGAGDERFALGLHAVSELITEMHREPVFQSHHRIALSPYTPIFRMAAPEYYREGTLAGFIADIRAVHREGGIANDPAFVETRTSRLYARDSGTKRYGLHKNFLPEHMEYLIAIPGEDALLVRFDAYLDFPAIASRLARREIAGVPLTLVEGGLTQTVHRMVVQKGGGRRPKSWVAESAARAVLSDETPVLHFTGANIAKLSLTTDPHAELGARVLDGIYSQRLLYTSSVRTAEMDSALTEFEREIIPAADTLAQLYNAFLSVDDSRAAFAAIQTGESVSEPLNPLQWVVARMEESPNPAFASRVLYVLNAIDARITPSTYDRIAGHHQDARERLHGLYREMQRMRGQFELLAQTTPT